MRKKYYSVPDIKVALDGLGYPVSEKHIYNIISAEGFSRLPRRAKLVRQQADSVQIVAKKSSPLDFAPEVFKSSDAGTTVIDKSSSILSFLALKLHRIWSKAGLLEDTSNLRKSHRSESLSDLSVKPALFRSWI